MECGCADHEAIFRLSLANHSPAAPAVLPYQCAAAPAVLPYQCAAAPAVPPLPLIGALPATAQGDGRAEDFAQQDRLADL